MTVEYRMADRLQELLQQRALIKEHLAWLESEIAAASGRPAEASIADIAPIAPSFPARPVIAIPTPSVSGPRVADETDALIAKLAAEGETAPPPSKPGCWVIFSVIILVSLLGAWALLHYFYRD